MGLGWCAMAALPDVSPVAALLADRTRSAILSSLLDGEPRSAGELALSAGVSPQVASNHLARLFQGGLLLREATGRQRHYRLAGEEVAQALEALAALKPPTPVLAAPAVPEGLRFARTCYDHLAGTLGVAVREALTGAGWLLADRSGYRTSAKADAGLGKMGISVAALQQGRRPFAKGCLDWSERRPHLAGALGAALLTRWLELGWLVRLPKSRAVRLTQKGRCALESELRLRLPAAQGPSEWAPPPA
jgi:DNA-binding transcriptional ArsR family regulator